MLTPLAVGAVVQAGFIFGAENASSFYVLDFPTISHLWPVESFWLTLSVQRADGWRKGIWMQQLQGLSSTPGLWASSTLNSEREMSFGSGRELSVGPQDEPASGNGWQENSNYGLVHLDDDPYDAMVSPTLSSGRGKSLGSGRVHPAACS